MLKGCVLKGQDLIEFMFIVLSRGILKWNEWFFTESPWRWMRGHHALWYHCLDAKVLAGLPTNITPNSMQIMFQCHCKYTFDFGPPVKVFRSFKGSMSRLQNENKKTHKKPLPYMDHGLSWDSGWNQLSPKHMSSVGERWISDPNGNLRAQERNRAGHAQTFTDGSTRK